MSRRLALLGAVVAALVLPAPALADVDVTITAFGFDPPNVIVEPGEAIHWTNGHLLMQSVTSDSGLFDSGPFPIGGGYTMAMSVPGLHTYRSAANPAFEGTIRVVSPALPGDPSELAVDNIPDEPFPAPRPEEIAVYPTWGVEASTVRVLIGIKPHATVGEVNSALASVNARVLGGLPDIGILLVQVPEVPAWAPPDAELEDLGRFTGLRAALEVLDESPAFEFSMMSTEVDTSALPRRSDRDDPIAAPPEDVGVTPQRWQWNETGGANWGLKDARFPWAWNLRESIARTDPTVVTGIIDGGFFTHPDLTDLTVKDRICTPGCLDVPNNGNLELRSHGTHVAGTIGAAWDNPGSKPGRSLGVSGANPFAHMVGASFASVNLFDTNVGLWYAFLRDRPPALRVVNFSVGMELPDPKTLAAQFPNQTCGPGDADDDVPGFLPGTKRFCVPRFEDGWLHIAADAGKAARRVAVEAARDDVMIVEASGNDSRDYCTPWGETTCGTPLPIPAVVSAEFAWASAHWEDENLANPIVVVEAIGPDGKTVGFSNWGGDIAAPGKDVGSTVNNNGYALFSGTSMAAPHVTAAIGYMLAAEPSLSIDEVRERLVEWGRPPPAVNGATVDLFTWDVPDRLNRDVNGDGIVDPQDSAADVRPDGFPVDLDACGWSIAGDPVVRYTWTIEGATIDRSSCRLRYVFPAEGEYQVGLKLSDADGDNRVGTLPVKVNDVLVAAVGDGLVSGEGGPDDPGAVDLGKRWQNARCHRSAKGGAAQAVRWLELSDVSTSVTFVNLACSGARIRGDRDVAGSPLPGPDGEGGLLTPYRGIEPSDPALDPQLSELASLAGGRMVDALLLSAGAADLRLREILADCLTPGNDCSTGDGRTIFQRRIAELPGHYDELDARLVSLGIAPDKVLAVEYPDFTRNGSGLPDLSCIPGGAVTAAEAQWLAETVVPQLNAALAAAATRHGWTRVDGIASDFSTHGYCASFPWVNRASAAALAAFIAGAPRSAAVFQPNGPGRAALGSRITGKLRAKLALTDIRPLRLISDATPRLDAYASLLDGEGIATRLVDVNDPSKDGNRRVIYDFDAEGDPLDTVDRLLAQADGEHTEPDGFVDMRDFRRFRDAWLGQCAQFASEPGCPADATEVSLDGGADHPKRDLNLDGCVRREGDPDGCEAQERAFSRFDFNGDGVVSAQFQRLVPLSADGKPVPHQWEGTKATDLDILRMQWSPDPNRDEGWKVDDAGFDYLGLLRSADVTVHPGSLLSHGARRGEVQVRNDAGEAVGPARTLKRNDGSIVMTVPVRQAGDVFRVTGTATRRDGTVVARSRPFTLKFGQDVRAELCSGLDLATTTSRLAADGEDEATLTASLLQCGGLDVAGKTITWTLDPDSAPNGPTLEPGGSTTDDSGQGTARLVAGTAPGTFTVKVTIDPGDGEPQQAELRVKVVPVVIVRYAWKQVVDEWHEEGSTRWGEIPDPRMPDCTTAVDVEYCIDSFSIGLDPETPYEVERKGKLTGRGTHVSLTEEVLNSTGKARSTWKLSFPGQTFKPEGSEVSQWEVTDPTAYTDHALDDVEIEDDDNGVHVRGIQAVGDLPYHTNISSQVIGTAPVEVHSTRREFLLIPQPEGTHLRFAAPPDDDIDFHRVGSGFDQYQSCGSLTKDLTTVPGYLVRNEDDEFLPGSTALERKTDYVPGDRPMPVGPGTLRAHYAFAATVSLSGDEPPAPVLPECKETHPPVAQFDLPPTQVDEGRQVRFTNRSTDPDHDIDKYEWLTGTDAWALSIADLPGRQPWSRTASSRSPYFLFRDEGPATVKLTVTDAKGATDTIEKSVVVRNLPPEAELDDAAAQTGQRLTLHYRTTDPGDLDRRDLRVRITSSNKNWIPIDRHESASVTTQGFDNVPAGTYPLTLTVTDPDGATTRDSAVAVVSSQPPDEEVESPFESPICDPTVRLDAEEREFLELVNDYRDDNGLPPVVASPSLTHAAERHAQDMADHDFIGHPGSDGSNERQRALDAGYPANAAVGENLAEGRTAVEVLWGWRGSIKGHNENMLVPEWRAIGISRVHGRIWRWATSYGNKVDCPTGAAALAPEAAPDRVAATVDAPDGNGPTATRTAASPYFSSLAALTSVEAEPAAEAPAADESPAVAPVVPPTVAFTISDVTPREGTPVTIVNRSRDSVGSPIPGTLFLEGPVGTALGPNEPVDHAYAGAGARSVRMTATDGASQSEATRVVSVQAKVPLALEYLNPHTSFAGASVSLTARADDPATATPVAGAELTFELDGVTRTATTGSSGLAAADFQLTMAPGEYTVTVRFAGNADFLASETTGTLTVLANTAPVADAGGPYVVGEGQALFLDGTRSSDPDSGDRVQRWFWELDGDGSFDDAQGATPAAIPFADLQTRLCGGACQTGHDYPVQLRVQDTRGKTATASTKVSFTADFAVVMAGGTFTVVPNASNSFGINVIGSSSWTAPVTLDVQGLPPGITASFNRNPVTPTGTSVLTLTAGASAPNGTFPITVTGTGNGITRTAGTEVEVTFGLVPKCFGAFTGVVTDRDTGEPIAGAAMFFDSPFSPDTFTDENGRYVLSGIELGPNNAPVLRLLNAAAGDRWPASKVGELSCGVLTQLDFQLRTKRPGHVSGRVIDKDTRGPIPAAAVRFASSSETLSVPADADGRFGTDLSLSPENAPRDWSATASADGYWPQGTSFTLAADAEQTLSFELVRMCFATFGGGVVLKRNTQIPLENATVILGGPGFPAAFTKTNAQGVYRFDRQIPLGQNNAPARYGISVSPPPSSPPGSEGETRTFDVTECGQAIPDMGLTVLQPSQNFGSLEGFVRDVDTNEPIADATVNIFGLGSAKSEADGHYRIDQISVGFDSVTTRSVSVSASKSGYFDSSAIHQIVANQTARADFTLLRQRFGTAVGTVRDSITGAPIPGATTTFGTTDRNGRYGPTQVTLGFRNAPITLSPTADAPNYWRRAKSATYTADQTTSVDFDLIRVCAAARVTGRVVNALTQAPIAGAFVQTSTGAFTVTNAEGRFELTNLQAGVDNAPVVLTVQASAPGFNFAQKQITIFCGATVVVDFGNTGASTGTIVGTVTNLDTGQPVAGAFVGAEFGAVATTDAAGGFRFTSVPLGPGDADREWKVSASVAGFKTMTKAVVAKANAEVRADFGFTKSGNLRPVADPRTYEVDEDPGPSPPALVLTGSDGDGDPITFHVMRWPAHGTVRGTAPNLDYVPDTDFNGTDSLEFVTFDGQDVSEPATVAITVRPVNDAPRAVQDSFGPLGSPARIPIASILANDTDADGDPLTIQSVQAFFPATAVIDGDDLVVTALPGEANVLYTINDGHGLISTARITIQIVSAPAAPVCSDATFQGMQDEPLAGHVTCTDANGDAVTYELVTPPPAGQLTFGQDGNFTYVPVSGFTGSVAFTFRAGDGTLTGAPATATLVIAPKPNRSPTAVDDSFERPSGAPARIPLADLLANDSDPDGDPLQVLSVSPVGDAQAEIDGGDLVVAEPAGGVARVDYVVGDGRGGSAPARVEVRFVGGNQAPVVRDTSLTVPEDGSGSVPIAASDADGDLLTLEIATPPEHGIVSQNGFSLFYTPAPDYHGPDAVVVSVRDAGHASEATVSITVTPVNDLPVARDDSFERPAGSAARIPLAELLENDTDIDGDTLGVTAAVPLDALVDARIEGSDLVVTAPGDGFVRVLYTVADGHGGSASARVDIHFVELPLAPVCADATFRGPQDTVLTGRVECSDGNGDAFAVELVSLLSERALSLLSAPAPGELVLEPDGNFAYAPRAGFQGTVSFAFRARDEGGLAGDTATATLVIERVDQPPPPPPPGDVVVPEQHAVSADLAVTMADDPDPVTLGGDVTYTLTARNAGPDAATGVVVADALPPASTFVSTAATQGSCGLASAIVTCTLGTLPVGTTVTITIVLRPTAAGLLDNLARIVGTLPEPNVANNTAITSTVVQSPAAPLTPPTTCSSMTITPRQLTAGKQATVVAHVRGSDRLPFADARVRFRGPGIAAVRKTDDDGVARLSVKAKRAGILRVTVLGSQSARCSVRSGIVGVFKTPLTG